MGTDLPAQEQIDGVWQRVRQALPPSYCLMAGRERQIMEAASRLYALGVSRPLMQRLYTQAGKRRRMLLAMARLSGEQECRPPAGKVRADQGELVRLLGLAAADYDPQHPVYGGIFRELRGECIRGQRALLG